MNLLPDKIGGNRKQYMWLGGLLVVLVVVFFLNRDSSTPSAAPTAPARPLPSIARQGPVVPEAQTGPKLATRSGRRVDDAVNRLVQIDPRPSERGPVVRSVRLREAFEAIDQDFDVPPQVPLVNRVQPEPAQARQAVSQAGVGIEVAEHRAHHDCQALTQRRGQVAR